MQGEPEKNTGPDRDFRRPAILFFILVPVILIGAILAVRHISGEAEPDGQLPAAAEVSESVSAIKETPAVSLETSASQPPALELSADAELSDSLPPEISQLFQGYFRAKLTGDSVLADSYFLSQETADHEEEDRRLRWAMEYIEDYQNIVCLGIPGPEPDSYVVYVSYEIKFYQSQTAAPSLSAAYVKKDEEGIYRIFGGIPDENVKEYMEQVSRLDSVTALTEQIQSRFVAALSQDAGLAALCEIAGSGTIKESEAGEGTNETPAAPQT